MKEDSSDKQRATSDEQRSRQSGSALVLAIVLMVFLGAATAALAPLALMEQTLSAAERDGVECRDAAEAVAMFAVAALQREPDWNGVLAGGVASGLADATRNPVIGGRRVDLDGSVAALGAPEPGSWGADLPRWRLFAWGPAAALSPGRLPTGIYVAAWVADDERDGDRDPLQDANGRLMIRGEAFGSVRGRRAVLVRVRRDVPAPGALRLLDWRTW